MRKYNSRPGRLRSKANSSSSFNSLWELLSCLFVVIMADIRDNHNASPMPGLARNDDPALDIAHEHQHPHVHHSPRAAHPDNIVYTTGTTAETPSKLLDNQVHHQHRHVDEKRDIEKAGGYESEVEKATRSSSDPEVETGKTKSKWSFSSLYRRFRLPVHIFLGMLFTG